jgi:hypothetical protein
LYSCREFGTIFTELAQPGGSQIVLRPARHGFGTGARVGFPDLERAAAERGEIALGLRLAREGLLLNPDREARWTLT